MIKFDEIYLIFICIWPYFPHLFQSALFHQQTYLDFNIIMSFSIFSSSSDLFSFMETQLGDQHN